MDGNRFDDLVRKLAEPVTRRRALKTFAGGLTASLAASIGRREAGASQSCRTTGIICRKNNDCCSNLCGAPDSTGRRKCKCNVANDCPAPGNACLTATCASGTCGFTNFCSQSQVCHNGSCCTPQSTDITCQNTCGAQIDNCGQGVNCGTCCLANDLSCTSNSECCSELCIDDVCEADPSGSGGACDETADCATGFVCCNGACRECCAPADCPGTDTECQTRTCVSNLCGVSNTPLGVPVSNQTAGDCKKNVCDGSGGVTTENDNADVPASQGECLVGKCTNGVGSQVPAALGIVCSTGFCNFAGVCAECQFNDNCPTGEICCQSECQISNDESCGCQQLVCGFGEACHDNDECIDILSDSQNCGSDGNQCEDNFECCNGVCIDIQNDEDNCGQCVNSCADGETCCAGSCCLNPIIENSICICN